MQGFGSADKAGMVDAPEAWEFPKPGTEDELAARRAAESPEDPQASTDPGAATSGNDKADMRSNLYFRTQICSTCLHCKFTVSLLRILGE